MVINFGFLLLLWFQEVKVDHTKWKKIPLKQLPIVISPNVMHDVRNKRAGQTLIMLMVLSQSRIEQVIFLKKYTDVKKKDTEKEMDYNQS